METIKVFQDTIDTENKEIVDLYNSAKSKLPNSSDLDDTKIVNEVDPEEVLSA